MAVLQCEMCGAPLKYKEGMHVAKCEYCDTVQILFDEQIQAYSSVPTATKKLPRRSEQKPPLSDSQKAEIYERAIQTMHQAATKKEFLQAANLFKQINSFRDAAQMEKECLEQAKLVGREEAYQLACEKMKDEYISRVEYAIELFVSLDGWRDSKQRLEQCYARVEELKVKFARERKKDRRKKRRWIYATLLILAVLGYCVANELYFKPMQEYERAMKDLENGNLYAAASAFKDMNFQDSEQQFFNLLLQDSSLVGLLKPGDRIAFGTMEQDTTRDGKEPISWVVLEVKGTQVFLLSERGLMTYPYLDYEQLGSVHDDFVLSWENSDLRTYLNWHFYRNKFTNQQKQIIIETENENLTRGMQQAYTTDKIFILSAKELIEYETVVQGIGDYLLTRTAEQDGVDPFAWWLRDVKDGGDRYWNVYVGYENDGIRDQAETTLSNDVGVRPCMWVDFSLAES